MATVVPLWISGSRHASTAPGAQWSQFRANTKVSKGWTNVSNAQRTLLMLRTGRVSGRYPAMSSRIMSARSARSPTRYCKARRAGIAQRHGLRPGTPGGAYSVPSILRCRFLCLCCQMTRQEERLTLTLSSHRAVAERAEHTSEHGGSARRGVRAGGADTARSLAVTGQPTDPEPCIDGDPLRSNALLHRYSGAGRGGSEGNGGGREADMPGDQ